MLGGAVDPQQLGVLAADPQHEGLVPDADPEVAVGDATAERLDRGGPIGPHPLDDPRAVALGSEPVRVSDELVGRVTSGGYGYTVERSIAYAYLPASSATPGTRVEVEIFGEWIPGTATEEPLFDPKGGRIRA